MYARDSAVLMNSRLEAILVCRLSLIKYLKQQKRMIRELLQRFYLHVSAVLAIRHVILLVSVQETLFMTSSLVGGSIHVLARLT